MPVTTVPVHSIRTNPKKVRKLSSAKIEQFRQAYEAGDDFPPIRVRDSGYGLVVIDGRNRLAAQICCGFTAIEVDLRD